MDKKTIVIVGGGASGFFCAINIAEQSDARVIILEKSAKVLSKVRISGGGRCNVTHYCDSIAEMSKKYPRGAQFVKKTFHQFFVKDTIAWFAKRGVTLKVENDNRMFPNTDDSETIINCFLKEANKHNVAIRLQHAVKNIEPQTNGFKLQIADRENIIADAVIVSCGGFPKMEQFDFLKDLGHTIAPPIPSLFTFNIPKHPIVQLMGLSVPYAQVKIVNTKLQSFGPLLITHWGLSGPAVLKLSAYGAKELYASNYHFKILVNWIGEMNEENLRETLLSYKKMHPQQKITNAHRFHVPQRLWDFLLLASEIKEAQICADLPAKQLNKLVKNLASFEFEVKGKTTFKEEFVTAGGIITSEVDSQSMMSKRHQNVFFTGEILDIDGITGGFNFQNAWTTAYIAAKYIVENIVVKK